MTSSHRLSTLQLAWIVYMSAAVAATAALAGVLLLQGHDAPAFEAEHLETNEEGALYRITTAQGPEGDALRWDQLDSTFPLDPFLDRDGVIQAEDVFFVHASAPGLTHVLQVALEGKVLWVSAFDAEPAADPVQSLLDELLDRTGPDGKVLVAARR